MEKITINLPVEKKYLPSIRLFTASVATNMNFDIEKIEDMRVLISEAVNYKKEKTTIQINYCIQEDTLTIEVIGKDKEIDEERKNMRDLILKELSDKVEVRKDAIILINKVWYV